MEQVTASYAGFWKRFAAYLIDQILLGVVGLTLALPFLGLLGIGVAGSASRFDEERSGPLIVALIGAYLFLIIAVMLLNWLYYSLMECSRLQATLGKMALGIKVTDMDGNRVSFGRATGRYFGKIISGLILCIGYMMAGFTQQKQALHDIMAGCLVVNK